MKKSLTLIALSTLSTLTSFAQQAIGTLEVNNIRCTVTSTGDLFYTPGTEDGSFEVPIGSGLKTIYAGNLWYGGISPDQQLKLAAETYQTQGSDWFTGPLTVDGAAETTAEVQEAYNVVWHVTSEEVEIHIAYFDALNNGSVDEQFPDGYAIPDVFFDWPAHGDANAGYAFNLAPFFDSNSNGFYDPENGDYPLFCGEECLYFIFNDKANVHSESGGQPIGLEIHGMLYGFNSTESEMLNNTVFLKYKIINRGTQTLADSYVGLWTDIDIGAAIDDYVGTQVKRSAYFGYNGDEIDEASTSSDGFGDDLPMQAVMFLAGPLVDSDQLDNPLPDDVQSTETLSYGPFGQGYDDGLSDNERFGLSYSMTHSNSSNPIFGNPSTPIHYYNFLRGIWKNGQVQTYGTLNGDTPSSYYAPGNSDPLNISTGEIEDAIWTEESEGNPPGDRRITGSCGPFTLEPQEVDVLDIAYVFVRESQAGGEPLESFFDNRLKEARLFYNEFLVECAGQNIELSTQEMAQSHPHLSIFPNPAQSEITLRIESKKQFEELQLTDMAGKLMKSFTLTPGVHTISIEEFASGVYMIQSGALFTKLMKE